MKKRFAMGFSIGLFIFIMINLLAAQLASDCGLLAVFGRDSPGTMQLTLASPATAQRPRA